jgi:hypothetical protein
MSASLRPDAPPLARAYAYEVSPDGTCTPPMTFAHAYNSGIWDQLSDDEQDEMLARKSPYRERREAADAKADLIAEFKARADTEKLKSKVEHMSGFAISCSARSTPMSMASSAWTIPASSL